MKNSTKTTFRSLVLATMSLFFTIKTNAQSSITPGSLGNWINGFTTIYDVKVVSGDTVRVWWEYSSDATFSAPDTLPSKTWTKDSSKVKDTFTVAKNNLPPVDSITGYNLYLRLAMKINGGTTIYGTPIQNIAVYPKPLKIKVSNFGITPLAGGGVLGLFGSAGSNYEQASVITRFRYSSSDVWRKPNPDSVNFVGMSQSFSRTLSGMLSNKTIILWVTVKNSVSNWDTVINFTTTPTSTKPVTAEAAGKIATSDSVFIKVEATSFNQSAKWFCINTVNNDTLIKSVMSPKMETIMFAFAVPSGNTKYTFLTYGVSTVGVGNKVTITITNPPKLVTPTFTAKTPDVRWNFDGQTYYILPKVDWITNSGDKINRIDVRIYTDSLFQSVPMVFKVSNAQAGLTGPITGERIDSDSGRFWYEFVFETEKGIYKSNLHGYDVNWKILPKGALSVFHTKVATEPVQCKLYNLSGQLISENYIVDPNINLFDSDLSLGILSAVPIDQTFKPFRVYNNQ